jgi:hypothetical protein
MKIKQYNISKSKIPKVMKRFMGFVLVDISVGWRNRSCKCWDWQGYICKKGYGRFWVSGRSCKMSHRVAYVLFKGPIKANRVIDHTCGNKICVNPNHLEMVTQRTNIKRARRNK